MGVTSHSEFSFPDQNGDVIVSGPKRNFQILSPLDFLAEFTQHIPPKGSHLIRYYGFHSNKSRGMRSTQWVDARKKPEIPGGLRISHAADARWLQAAPEHLSVTQH